jgi:hypothetical protein
MNEPRGPEAYRQQLARAIGSLIWKDPERIIDTVSRFRDSDVVIECRLRGASMEPAIPRGASLRVSLARATPCRIGDVVAFVQDTGICVHRVAYVGRGERASGFILTQGDACFYPDAPVAMRQVVGHVREFRHDERWVATDDGPARGRAQSLVGRTLLKLVAGLLELDARLARGAAAALRLRQERPTVADA